MARTELIHPGTEVFDRAYKLLASQFKLPERDSKPDLASMLEEPDEALNLQRMAGVFENGDLDKVDPVGVVVYSRLISQTWSEDYTGGAMGLVENLVVSQEQQNQGLAKLLLGHAELDAQQLFDLFMKAHPRIKQDIEYYGTVLAAKDPEFFKKYGYRELMSQWKEPQTRLKGNGQPVFTERIYHLMLNTDKSFIEAEEAENVLGALRNYYSPNPEDTPIAEGVAEAYLRRYAGGCLLNIPILSDNVSLGTIPHNIPCFG